MSQDDDDLYDLGPFLLVRVVPRFSFYYLLGTGGWQGEYTISARTVIWEWVPGYAALGWSLFVLYR